LLTPEARPERRIGDPFDGGRVWLGGNRRQTEAARLFVVPLKVGPDALGRDPRRGIAGDGWIGHRPAELIRAPAACGTAAADHRRRARIWGNVLPWIGRRTSRSSTASGWRRSGCSWPATSAGT